MIKHIKTETNRYDKSTADKRRRTNKLKPHSIWQKCTGVRLHEMYFFFAVIIHTCLVKKPKLRDYWSTSNFISTQFSGSVMSINRLTVILSNLHVNDDASYIPRNEAYAQNQIHLGSSADSFHHMRILPLMKVYVDFREE